MISTDIADRFPHVSILMPIRNEGTFIAHSLSAVLDQDYPAERLEVLVIDGMSDDKTRAIVQQMAHGPIAVHLLDNPGHVVPTAFNIGLRQAKGSIIVRVDGHCVIAPDYVRCCVEVLQATGADNVGGLQRSVGQNLIGRAIALATSSPFGVGNARFRYAEQPGWVDTVYLGAYRRTVFERIGGFDEELIRNQDDEFNFRLTQSGGKIWLDPAIQSSYYSRSSLRGLWRQYFQYGFYKVRVIQKRGAVSAWRHLVPAAFVLSLFISLALALVRRQVWLAGGVTVPYALANGLASAKAARRDWHTLPLLPLMFFVLHCAYGAGFLAGLWHWTRRTRSLKSFPSGSDLFKQVNQQL